MSIERTPITFTDLVSEIKNKPISRQMKALILGIATTRPINSFEIDGGVLNAINYNPYEISADSKQPGSLDSYISERAKGNRELVSREAVSLPEDLHEVPNK